MKSSDQKFLAEAYGEITKHKPIVPEAASKKAIVINLEYGNEEFSQAIPSSEIKEATEGLEPIKAKNGLVIYRAETYVVVVME